MKLPIVATLVVALAAAAMIGLGIWQLDRRAEKEALLDRYRTAAELPAIAYPAVPDPDLVFRRATGFCREVAGWRLTAGRNRAGESGWSHIASCRTGGGEGPGMQVVAGWSRGTDSPEGWRGGVVSGVIAPDSEYGTRLVADEAAPGLEPAAAPSVAEVPNNHLFYAIQWFAFAAIAVVIYLLAVRRRRRR